MSARPVIQTYRLASLHEAAIARLKNPKNDRYKELYLQNRGCGATVAAVSDVSRCTEQEILDAVGFKMQQGLNSKAVKCKAGHQRLDAERTKTDLPKERKSPSR